MYDSETLKNMTKYRTRFSENQEAIYDVDNDKHYTYKDLETRSDKLAWFLTKKLGLKKGDRIGFCALSSVQFFDAYYVTFKTGIIITTYNFLLREKELFSLIENEAPKVMFYSGELVFVAMALKDAGFDSMEYICLDEKVEDDKYCYEDIMNISSFEPVEAPDLDFEDIQMLIHTGGTTGKPKAAMMSFRSIFFNALVDIMYLQVTETDSEILTLPLFHTAGWNVLTLALLMVGGRVIICRMFNTETVLKLIRSERPTIGISVETMYKAMAMHPDFAGTDLTCYRFLLTGAAPTGKDILEVFWKKGVKTVNSYGMTEVGPNNMSHPTWMKIDDVRKKWNSCGILAPFNQVKFVDDEGNEVAKGEKGEMVFNGKLLFSGYWNNPEATAEVMQDGWVHSGDVAYQDDEGFCYICGRKKNMFISGGENIFPQEIEDTIMLIPGVLEACVIGVADQKWGEVGRALIVTAPGTEVSAEQIKAAVKAELSTIKVPKYVTFVSEVPKNAIGKRDQAAISELYGKAEN